MIFDHEAAILARLAAKCAPGSRLLGTFDVVDFTDTAITPVVGQVRLSGIEPAGQTGTNARVHIAWSFDVYVDLHRASPTEKTDAAALLADGAAALVGWEIEPGHTLQLASADPTAFDGRTLRIAIAFTLPAYLVGT